MFKGLNCLLLVLCNLYCSSDKVLTIGNNESLSLSEQ